MNKHHEPTGRKFFDTARGRAMILADEGPWDGWLFFQHADGHWVSLRKATDDDKRCLEVNAEQIVWLP
jgi:hypothetical protein